MNPARSNKWKFMVTPLRLRGCLNLAFLRPHYNHCIAVQHRVDCGSVRS
jgi:hypothetical protein